MQLDARHQVERANSKAGVKHGCARFHWIFETICRNAGDRVRHAI
jgi:hypothetical protein